MARKHLALAQFIQATASLTKDGECVSCGKDGHEPNPGCHTHAPWDMRNDDAVETLHGLISNARRLNSQRSALSLEDAIHQIEQFGDTLNVSGRMCVLTGDEVQALVDFAREVIGLAVEDDDGKEPGYLLVAGQLDTDTIKRFDAIIRHHGFEELIQDGELDDDLCNHRDEDSVYCDCHCGCQCGICRRQRETAPVDSPSGNGPTPEPDETAGKLDHVPIRRQPVDDCR